ncbi:1599_t:CDS:2, partial [Gigaspora margarita]
LPCQPLQFNCLINIRKTACVEQKRNSKQKYGFGMGYAKKVLDYAIQADKVNKFVNYLGRFIETIKSDLDKQQENDSGEIPLKKKAWVHQDNTVDQTVCNNDELNSNSKRVKLCHKCKQA